MRADQGPICSVRADVTCVLIKVPDQLQVGNADREGGHCEVGSGKDSALEVVKVNPIAHTDREPRIAKVASEYKFIVVVLLDG